MRRMKYVVDTAASIAIIPPTSNYTSLRVTSVVSDPCQRHRHRRHTSAPFPQKLFRITTEALFMKKLLCIALLFSSSLAYPAYAQGPVTGSVLDVISGNGILEVRVEAKVDCTEITSKRPITIVIGSALTGADGNFSMTLSPPENNPTCALQFIFYSASKH